MNNSKTTAKIAGALFFAVTVTSTAGGVILDPILQAPDYLVNLYPKYTQVGIAVLFELIEAIAIAALPVLLFPILKKQSKTIALGYLGFRVVEAVFIIVSAICILPLLTISREFIEVGMPAASWFQTLGDYAIAGRHWAFQIAVIYYYLTALMFFYSSFQSRLLLRFLSIWSSAFWPRYGVLDSSRRFDRTGPGDMADRERIQSICNCFQVSRN
jgi:hypothetical protein